MILSMKRALWPPDAREEFEERAAILEFDARMTRAEAERLAAEIVRAQWKDKA